MTAEALEPCALCGRLETRLALSETRWLSHDTLARIASEHPGWRRVDGGCPACVQQTLLEALLEGGENAFHRGVQSAWPLDAESAFGALPSPLRLHADPRFSGRGVTIALVDSGFFPHPDLIRPVNRIKAWADAGDVEVPARRFQSDETPAWPGSGEVQGSQWHGLMTSTVAAGNGRMSHGLYRGIAPDAEVILVQARDANGRITNDTIVRALRWLLAQKPALGISVVSLSVAGDPVSPLPGNPVDLAVEALVAAGVTVIAASGNDGVRRLAPPATSPDALTVGGLDDRNTLDHDQRVLWHSNYGQAATGALKPELVAPSLWVVAPLLPGSSLALEASSIFERRGEGDAVIEARIAETKLVTPHYQHVEGTSFAAPLVAATVACMLEANPKLRPKDVRQALCASAHRVEGAPTERQGAGVVDVGRAIAAALVAPDILAAVDSPWIEDDVVVFTLADQSAGRVCLSGGWDQWSERRAMTRGEGGRFSARLSALPPGRHAYKFLLSEGTTERWIADPANSARIHDGYGGYNSVLEITETPSPPSCRSRVRCGRRPRLTTVGVQVNELVAVPGWRSPAKRRC